jgi:phage regulator Rha-like protein
MLKNEIAHMNIDYLIYFLRGERVMLDSDLAVIYGVETKVLNQAVKRNLDRFPEDFMFRLTQKEWDLLRSQIVTSKENESLQPQNETSKRGGRRTLPYVFTEHGAMMLASVLNSTVAVEASIQVVRTFIKLRKILETHKDLERKLKEMERKYDKQFKIVFDAIRQLMMPPEKPKRPIGFQIEPVKEKK